MCVPSRQAHSHIHPLGFTLGVLGCLRQPVGGYATSPDFSGSVASHSSG